MPSEHEARGPHEPHVEPLDDLVAATQRLIRTVDSLGDDTFAEPSLLPGWTRAHVVAHLTLNAEGLAGVLRGVVEGRDVPMYESNDSRATAIDTLAATTPADLRERFLGSTTLVEDAVVAVPAGGWVGDWRRTSSGGEQFPRIAIPAMRHVEVEVHHADLGAGYGPRHWPEEFVAATFHRVVADHADGPGAVLRGPQGDVALGGGAGPVVTGALADLTWWLLGRGTGQGLVGDPHLPELGPWR